MFFSLPNWRIVITDATVTNDFATEDMKVKRDM